MIFATIHATLIFLALEVAYFDTRALHSHPGALDTFFIEQGMAILSPRSYGVRYTPLPPILTSAAIEADAAQAPQATRGSTILVHMLHWAGPCGKGMLMTSTSKSGRRESLQQLLWAARGT